MDKLFQPTNESPLQDQDNEIERCDNFGELEKRTIVEALGAGEFSGRKLELMEKYINGNLAPEDETYFIATRNLWWNKKFGFSYENDILKKTVLEAIEKYSGYEDDKLPTIMAQIIPLLKSQKEIDELLNTRGGWSDETRKIAKNNSNFRTELINFFGKNIQNKEFCREIWEEISKLAKISGNEIEKGELQKSVLSQLATIIGFKEIGLTPVQSNPNTDVLRRIDLIVKNKVGTNLIQIKSSHLTGGLLIASADEISTDGVVLQSNKVTIVDIDGEKFRAAIERYGQGHKSKLENSAKQWQGYVIVVPPQNYSDIGEPNKELVDTLKSRFL